MTDSETLKAFDARLAAHDILLARLLAAAAIADATGPIADLVHMPEQMTTSLGVFPMPEEMRKPVNACLLRILNNAKSLQTSENQALRRPPTA